jgi:glyoxylase-like metal-dependent hydrolase (beta-lactamase superfamily II)
VFAAASIQVIDLHYLGNEGSIASYVLPSDDGPVLIETGPRSTLKHLETGLKRLGWSLRDVRHALVTHIHLDHAGAAGQLAAGGTRIYVHEFGAQHLIDPSRLNASARRIYGPLMESQWGGDVVAVPADLITAVHDGDCVDAGGVSLRAIESPGHARHHHSFALETDLGPVAFTGDAAACYVAGSRFVSLPMPPPEFDRDVWQRTLDRLEAESFARIYPTHFGPCDEPAAHYEHVREDLHEQTRFLARLIDDGLEDEAIYQRYKPWLMERAREQRLPENRYAFYVSESVTRMNITGMRRFLASQSVKQAGAPLSMK